MAAPAGAPAPAVREKTPCTIITGFLGAGKTTLLNYILREKGSRSLAVIENEFGEVNIDRELVADNLVAKEDLVSLENGCVCCSLRKDIVKAFAEIERRNRQNGKKVDGIILETTGLADPAPVAFTFFANPWIASRFRLDSIICVVDARYLLQHLEDATHQDGTVNEAVQQLAFADLILLNKVDLVKEDAAKQEVISAIKRINNSARIIECQLNQPDGRPPMDQLLLNNLFSVNRVLEQIDPKFLDSDSDSDAEGDASPSPRTERPSTAAQISPAAASAGGQTGGASRAAAGDAEAVAAGSEEAGASAAASGAGSGAGLEEAARAKEAAERSGGQVGPSKSAFADAAGGRSSKYSVERPSLTGHKHARDGGSEEHCEDHCMECSIIHDDGAVKGERQPRRKAKRLHDLSDVSSVGIMARGQLDEYRFNMYMRDLLTEKAKDIFRCKGVLSVHGYGNKKFVFQGVHETICYGPTDTPWKPDEQRINQVVFIGRGLDRKALIEGFRTCVWVPLPDNWEEFRDPTTKQPYYVNKQTGQKQWTRPEAACARVVATQGATQQPSQLLPKRQPSILNATALGAAGQQQQVAAGAMAGAGAAEAEPVRS